jgi:prolyl oligopeptidase
MPKPLVCALVLSALAAIAVPAQTLKTPPATRADNVTETINGVSVNDPYRWLEDQNSPETRAWIDAQDQYTESVLGKLPGRDQIHQRLEKLLKIDTITPPFERGGRYFFYKRRADQNQPVVYMRHGARGKDEALIDPNSMGGDLTTSIRVMDGSADGKLLVYGTRHGGEDETSLSILDVDSRKDLSDKLPRARYFGLAMKPDKSGFYYSKSTDGLPGVFYHQMGTEASSDAQIFGKGFGKTDIINPQISEDGRFLAIFVHHGAAADNVKVYVQDLERNGPITTIVDDVPANFEGDVEAGHLYLRTNWQAPNSRIVDIDLASPGRDHWRTVVPEGQSAIESFSLAGGKLFLRYLDNVTTRIAVFDPAGQPVREIKFPTLGTAGAMNGRWSSDEAFYTFTSFAQPATIYRYNVSSGSQEEWARINVPIASDQIEVKQVWYQSKDKTRIPMFLVYKKGLQLDGNRPVYLTGYGGFNLSLTPSFSAMAAYWAENGGVFAQPSLRGGGEFGEKWHRAGMLANKQNVFDDFIGAAEWLISNHYTRSSRLAIGGGSNGGLLVGAALTQRPDLFQAVVCSFPLLDMVRYQNFLVARFWVPEYGSSEDANQFPYILKYSPYHNVKKGVKYPAVLLISGDSDTRVAPLHARKMAALLQASTGSDRPIVLHYDTKAGHSGGLPVSKQIDNLTDELSFLFWQLGVTGG